ncbi:MAG: Spy/CpxP family protein refolding chaperone [Pseudomonadota bacterium]
MKLHTTRVAQLILAAGLVLAAHFPVQAQGMPQGDPEMETRGLPGGIAAPFEHAPCADFLHGIKLTEEQEDKVFAIVHAQQPLLREQMKAAHKARQALHAMSLSAQYDDHKAKALADAAARAMADTALLRTRGDQQIYALLTAEQRKQLEDLQEKSRAHDSHRRGLEQPPPPPAIQPK